MCRPKTRSGLFPPLPSDPMAWSPSVCEACARHRENHRKTPETLTGPWNFAANDNRREARELFRRRSFSGHLLRRWLKTEQRKQV